MITPQSANFKTLLTARQGRPAILQAYIEGIPDVICSEAPPDTRTKTYAINFDGTDDYIACGTAAALSELADWTLIAWIKSTSFASERTIASWGTNANGTHRVFVDTSARLSVRYKGYGFDIPFTTTLSANTWHYVAVALGGNARSILRAIIDDTELTPTTPADAYTSASRAARTITAGTNNFYIGEFAGTGSSPWIGRIGYVAIYNRALTYSEMRRLRYRRVTVAWGNDDSEGLWDDLVAQWDIERGTGTTLANSKSSSHTGTLTNGPTWVSDAPYTATYRAVLSAEASTSQDVEPLGTRTGISAATLRVLDTDEWFTDLLADIASLSLPRRKVELFMGFRGLVESEYQLIFRGIISDFSYENRAYALRLSDALSEVKKKQAIAKTALSSALNAGAAEALVPVSNYFFTSDDNSGYYGYVKIDDEIIRVDIVNSNDATTLKLGTSPGSPLLRGRFGTTDATHASGAVVREIWALEGTTAVYLILQFLLSGAGFEAVSSYDDFSEATYTNATNRLTRGRGLGMAPSDIAIAEIEALVSGDATFGDNQHSLYILESVQDMKDLVESESLRALAAFFYVKADGRLSIARHKIPTSSDVVDMITPDMVHKITWESTHADIVNYIEVDYDYNPGTGDFDSTYVATSAASGTRYGVRKREYEFKSVTSTTDLDELKTQIFARFKDPYVTIETTLGLSAMFYEIGDVVRFTHLELPNISTGTRGIHEQLWQVISRKLDIRRGQVVLGLADLSRA